MNGTKQATSGTLSRSAPARGKFRKICLVLLLLVTAALCGFAPQAYAANWIDYADTGWYYSADEWDGIGNRTYEISTAEELAGLAKLVNEGTENFESQIIRLTADIDLAGKDWTPIGKADTSSAVVQWRQDGTGISGSNNKGNYFNGMFFGDGHKITNLKIDLDESRVGLFSVLGVGGDGSGEYLVAVSDLTVEGEVAGASFCGLIAGDGGGATIANCKVKGTVRGSNLHTWEYPDLSNGYPSYAPPQSWSCIGGVAGKGQADNCVAEVTVEGIYKIGGVVGSGIAYGCSASGTVTSLLTDNNAFVTDINENVKIRNAQIPPGSVLTWSGREPEYYLADEKLSCAYYDYAGGVAGTGTAVSCRSSVTVKAENLQAVGGVVGGGKALNCAYTGESVTGAHNVGGVVGTGEASNCYAKGTVLATYSKFSSFEPLPEGEQPENHAPIQGDYKEYWVYLGGIVGQVNVNQTYGDGIMVNCVSECQLQSTQKGYGIGQITGYASITREDFTSSSYVSYNNEGSAFYNLAWTETDYPPFGIVEQMTTQEQAPRTVEYVYAGVSDDGVLDLPKSYVSGFVEKAIKDNTYGVKGGAYDDAFYNKHNAFQRNDVSGIVAAVLPENGIAGMNNPKFNFVGYPKNDASGNVSLVVPVDAGFAVKTEGAVIELSGIPASYKTASFAYGTVVMASDVNNPSQTIGEDYYAHIGNANEVNYSIGGISFTIAPVINADGGKGIGQIDTYRSVYDTYTTYPSGILLAVQPGGEEPQPSGVEKVTLDRTEVSLEPAGWVVLKATVWPNGASQTVKWSSSDTNIAVVDANGFVTAKAGDGGTATIRAAAAADESKYAECEVTVAPMAAPEATRPTIADSVVISDDIDKTAAAEAFTSTGAAAEAISSDIALEQDGNGPVYPTQEAADAAVEASLAEDETLAESTYRLPVFSVSTSSPAAAAAWIVQGPALLADNIEDVDIRKIISGKEAAKFVYKAADFTDGSFTILNTDGTQAAGHIDRTAKYQILLFIADNGSFDLNKAEGIIADPAVIVRTSKTEPTPEPEPTPSGGGGGGGCSAGWGALALLAVVPLFARRKK